MSKKSWKWIRAYEEARKTKNVPESTKIADMTIKKRKKTNKITDSWF